MTLLEALFLLWLTLAPMFGTMTYYDPTGNLTASGEPFTGEEMSCAIERSRWDAEWACGYGRGECREAIVAGEKGAARIVVNDTGAYGWGEGMLLDCSSAVFKALFCSLERGVGEITLYPFPR